MAGRGFEPRCKGNETKRVAKAWKIKEKQRLCMQGVELTSEGNE